MSIRKIKGGCKVVSKKGKSLGAFKGKGARAKCKKRLAQVEHFKRKGNKRG